MLDSEESSFNGVASRTDYGHCIVFAHGSTPILSVETRLLDNLVGIIDAVCLVLPLSSGCSLSNQAAKSLAGNDMRHGNSYGSYNCRKAVKVVKVG